jgi:hypothetical protein
VYVFQLDADDQDAGDALFDALLAGIEIDR